MKKKDYQKPSQYVVPIKAWQLLAGTTQDPGPSQSRRRDDWDN